MSALDAATLGRLLAEHAPARPLPFVPEIVAHHAADELPLWEALERATESALEPPFFALAWPAGQALARLVLDGAVPVAGRRVVDVGCGSGVVAIAAALRGAAVVAVDLDPLALGACQINAAHNRVHVAVARRDALADPELDADLVLAGDLVYHRAQVPAARQAIAAWRARGCEAYLADGGRPHFDALAAPELGLGEIAALDVPAEQKIEGAAARRVRIYRLGAGPLRRDL